MNTAFEIYWGIDVSKEWLDVATSTGVTRIAQTEKAIKKFAIKNHPKMNTLVVLESTGGYEKPVARILASEGYTVHVAHPNKVKAFARAKGRLAKTDKIDSILLKEYGSFIDLEEIRSLPSVLQEELSAWGARLGQLKEMHHQESCRFGIAMDSKVKKSIQRMLKLLKIQIEEAQEVIKKLIESDAELKEKFQILRSMKGVGPVLAMILITDLPELGIANKKEIAALVGVAPITNESGKKFGRSAIRYGRSSIRKVLYMGALTACKHDPKFRTFYEKLVTAGKPKKVAIVAVMRKMVVVLNAMMQSKKQYFA